MYANMGVRVPLCTPQVVISGLSSPAVLTEDGIVNFARAIGL